MVEVKKVTGRKEENDFIRLTDMIYRDCPQYVPDLRNDVRALIRPKAAGGGHGALRLQPFVAYRDGKPVGRIVGIVNQRTNEKWKTKC